MSDCRNWEALEPRETLRTWLGACGVSYMTDKRTGGDAGGVGVLTGHCTVATPVPDSESPPAALAAVVALLVLVTAVLIVNSK